jgi:hypothetical protein
VDDSLRRSDDDDDDPACATRGLASELLESLRDAASWRRSLNDLTWVIGAPAHAKEVAFKESWQQVRAARSLACVGVAARFVSCVAGA